MQKKNPNLVKMIENGQFSHFNGGAPAYIGQKDASLDINKETSLLNQDKTGRFFTVTFASSRNGDTTRVVLCPGAFCTDGIVYTQDATTKLITSMKPVKNYIAEIQAAGIPCDCIIFGDVKNNPTVIFIDPLDATKTVSVKAAESPVDEFMASVKAGRHACVTRTVITLSNEALLPEGITVYDSHFTRAAQEIKRIDISSAATSETKNPLKAEIEESFVFSNDHVYVIDIKSIAGVSVCTTTLKFNIGATQKTAGFFEHKIKEAENAYLAAATGVMNSK